MVTLGFACKTYITCMIQQVRRTSVCLCVSVSRCLLVSVTSIVFVHACAYVMYVCKMTTPCLHGYSIIKEKYKE